VERPDLLEPAWEATSDAFPEYNNHGDVLNRYWGRLVDQWPGFQFHLVEDDEIVARARSIPLRWDGTVDGLPAGIDGAIASGADDAADPNTLCALLIAVPAAARGRGASADALRAMVEIARGHGFTNLIAPVRPSWKERYPITPIERYASWRRADGLLFDPWLRVHERAGGTILRAEPHSLRITGTVAEWESWTELPFPQSGEYVFPGGLATLDVDREGDIGSYWEPNVWMCHRVRR
jgi:hypothetical protein